MKFHIAQDGRAARCEAAKRACPLGGEHYDSLREALIAAEAATPTATGQATAFKPLSKSQADQWLASMASRHRAGLSEEELEEWLTRDHTAQVKALETALTQLDDEQLAHRTLQEAGLLQAETYWSDHDGEERFAHYSLKHGGTGGGYRQRRVEVASLKQSILWHRRHDRTTLMTAMGIDPSSLDGGGEVLYASIAKGLADDLGKQREQEAADKEAARRAAPTDWVKVPVKRVRDELGDHYDETNSQHQEFEKELEAIGMTRDQYFSRPGYHRRDEYKNMVIERVKARHQELADEAAMTRVPNAIDWQKTSTAKLTDALGPKYDATLPLHQELRAKVDAMTPAYKGKVYLDPHGQPAQHEHTHRREGRWVANEEVTSPTAEQREVLRQDEVASSIRYLFSSHKASRADMLKGFKQRLDEHGSS